MQWAVGKSQFEWLAQNKHRQSLFNSYMSSRRHGKPSWFDVYPVERLTNDAVDHQEAVFLVDVGGNQGHDLVKFQDTHPGVPGRLVLQDLPKVVSRCPGGRIEGMGYSFLDPQPIKGMQYFSRTFDRFTVKLTYAQAQEHTTSALFSMTGQTTSAARF